MPHVNNAPVSIKAAKLAKPEKPYADFPLTAHPSGRWCKKVRGKVLFFGPWRDPQGSLTKWLAEKDYLLAGRVAPPNAASGGLTVADLCNRFLTGKLDQKPTGELTARSFADYNHTTDRIVALLGKSRLVDDLTTEDFEKLRAALGMTLGPASIGSEVRRIRCVLRHGFEACLMARPVPFGPMFKRPSRKVLRRLCGDCGEKIVEAAKLRKIIDERLRVVVNHVCAWLFPEVLKAENPMGKGRVKSK